MPKVTIKPKPLRRSFPVTWVAGMSVPFEGVEVELSEEGIAKCEANPLVDVIRPEKPKPKQKSKAKTKKKSATEAEAESAPEAEATTDE